MIFARFSAALSLCRCVAVLLCRCIAVLLCRCIAVSLCRCVAVLLCCCVAVLLCCCVALLLYHCAAQLFRDSGCTISYKLGAMMEVPRACMRADAIAQEVKLPHNLPFPIYSTFLPKLST